MIARGVSRKKTETNNNLVANIEGKLLAERAVHRWQDNVKMNLKYNSHGVGWVGQRTGLAFYGDVTKLRS